MKIWRHEEEQLIRTTTNKNTQIKARTQQKAFLHQRDDCTPRNKANNITKPRQSTINTIHFTIEGKVNNEPTTTQSPP